VNINDLQKAITQKFGTAKGVYVRADKETIWESLAQVVSMLGQAGLQVNMVTQPEDTAVKRR
jgi:biopolymer transport protein ExbD